MERRTRNIAVGVGLGALLFAGGVASAQIPQNGNITTCYMKSGGAIRVIDAATTGCRSNETQLVIDQDGTQGEPGINGISGYEIVRDQGTQDGSTSVGIAKGVQCPEGKVVLSGFGTGLVEPAAGTIGPADLVGIDIITGVTNAVVASFAKVGGDPFVATDSFRWSVGAVCADLAPDN